MRNIVIDIETCPQENLIHIFTDNIRPPKTYKDPDKIKEWLENATKEQTKKMSVDIDYGDIRCIGCKIEDEPSKIITLDEFWEVQKDSRIIGFNHRKFDLPLLVRNSLKYGVTGQLGSLNKEINNRYSDRIIDLMEKLGNYGDWKSLDTYLQIYLGISKTPIDFETCSQEELEDHCLEDCDNTYKLYNYFKEIL